VILNYPDSDHVPEALFYAGLCYHHLRNFGTATQIFDGLLTQYPDFEGQDEILFVAAEGLETAGDLGGALKQYALIIERFPESRRREDALERVGTIHFEAAHYDSALEAYSVLARTSRDDAVYIEAQFRRGSCLVRLNRPAEALDIYERILPDDAERQELGGRAWLAMAEAYNRDGRHEEALERLERVVENFQNRPAAIEALFMTGYTHEVYLRQYEEAEKAYQAAVDDRSRSVFRDQAVRRLQNLRNVMELAREDEGTSDREQRALAALKVAEFSLLETLEPRVALDQYAGVEQDFPETDAARRASYARGWIFYHDLDSLARAEEILSRLIESHPGSNQAAGARTLLERMELPAERLAVFDSLIERAQAEERARADSLEAAAAGDSTAPAAADSLEVLPKFGPAAADSLVALPKFGPAAADSLVALPMFEPPSADSLEAFPVFASPPADSVMREDALRMPRPEGSADGDSLADSTALEAPAPDSTAAPSGDEP
ncbi:MAG: tetratricopeptide repeat protein, partial [Candidatus Eisenbacteria bacterium]